MSLFSIGNASTETIVFFLANHELLLDLSMIYIDMCMWSHWSTLLGTITYLLPIWHFWVDVSPFPVNGGICWSSSSGLLRGHLLANFHGCKFSNLLHVFFLKWEWLKTRGSCSFFSLAWGLVFFLCVELASKKVWRLYLNHLETLKYGCSFHCELSTGKLSRRFLRVLNERFFLETCLPFLEGVKIGWMMIHFLLKWSLFLRTFVKVLEG